MSTLGIALVAGGAVDLLQAGRTDVQDTAYVSTSVSQSAPQSTQWHSVTAVISCSISRCAVQTHWHRKRSFSCAEPATWNSLPRAVINCDTLSVYQSRLKTRLFNTAYLFRQRLWSYGTMVLYKCIIIIIIIIKILHVTLLTSAFRTV